MKTKWAVKTKSGRTLMVLGTRAEAEAEITPDAVKANGIHESHLPLRVEACAPLPYRSANETHGAEELDRDS